MAAGYGTGKTLLLFHRARELASAGEQVLFIVFAGEIIPNALHPFEFTRRRLPDTLLTLELKNYFEDLSTLTVKQVTDVSEFDSILDNCPGTTHIFMDEVPYDEARLCFDKLRASPSIDTIWVALRRGDSHGQRSLPQLKKCLRNEKSIVEFAKLSEKLLVPVELTRDMESMPPAGARDSSRVLAIVCKEVEELCRAAAAAVLEADRRGWASSTSPLAVIVQNEKFVRNLTSKDVFASLSRDARVTTRFPGGIYHMHSWAGLKSGEKCIIVADLGAVTGWETQTVVFISSKYFGGNSAHRATTNFIHVQPDDNIPIFLRGVQEAFCMCGDELQPLTQEEYESMRRTKRRLRRTNDPSNDRSK